MAVADTIRRRGPAGHDRSLDPETSAHRSPALGTPTRAPVPVRGTGLALAAATAAVAVVAAIVVAAVGTWLVPTRGAGDPRIEGTEALAEAEFEEATGVRIVRVSTTAAGGLLDLRYQVLDPDKALVVHDADRPPALRSARTGTVLAERWHDHVTTRALQHAVVYHELLVNTAGALQPAEEVSVLIGDWRLDGVVVG